jgi:hypothetical protein
MSGFSTPCSSMFMLPMRSMVLSKSKPWKVPSLKRRRRPRSCRWRRVVRAQVLGGGDQEARGAAGGVADHILRRRGGHVDHQLDDVARGAELAVLPGAGDLAEHVLVEVALGVASAMSMPSSWSTTLASTRGVGIMKSGVLHVVRVGRVALRVRPPPLLPRVLMKGKTSSLTVANIVLRRHLLEARPAQGVLILA